MDSVAARFCAGAPEVEEPPAREPRVPSRPPRRTVSWRNSVPPGRRSRPCAVVPAPTEASPRGLPRGPRRGGQPSGRRTSHRRRPRAARQGVRARTGTAPSQRSARARARRAHARAAGSAPRAGSQPVQRRRRPAMRPPGRRQDTPLQTPPCRSREAHAADQIATRRCRRSHARARRDHRASAPTARRSPAARGRTTGSSPTDGDGAPTRSRLRRTAGASATACPASRFAARSGQSVEARSRSTLRCAGGPRSRDEHRGFRPLRFSRQHGCEHHEALNGSLHRQGLLHNA